MTLTGDNGLLTKAQEAKIKNEEGKYQTGYKGNGASESSEDRRANYEASKEMYGDAVWETFNKAAGAYSWNEVILTFRIWATHSSFAVAITTVVPMQECSISTILRVVAITTLVSVRSPFKTRALAKIMISLM